MLFKKDHYYYAIKIDDEVLYYHNIKEINSCPCLASHGYENLRKFQIHNLINGKYTGRMNSKWNKIKVYRLKTPIHNDDIHDIIEEKQREDRTEDYLFK